MYAIVDIDTTGGYATKHAITEIAILIHDGRRLVKRFETLVNPGRSIPAHITALTGISNRMVEDAPTWDEVAETVADMLRGCIFVAHHVNFDYSFVKQQLKMSGLPFQSPRLCTVRLSRRLMPGLPSYSLGKLCRYLDIPVHNRHRAGGDAEATVQLWETLLQQEGVHETMAEMLAGKSGDQWLPWQLDQKLVEQLPQEPGVYYFLNARRQVIYVGKAVNIRKRVKSHFTGHDTDRKRQEMLRKVALVQYTVCENELQALVLESHEIRKRWPVLNKSQKLPAVRYGLYSYEDHAGYRRLVIDRYKKNLPTAYRFHLLHEGLTLLSALVEKHGLDRRLCYLDKTAFTDAERDLLPAVKQYNRRVVAALSDLEQNLPSFVLADQSKEEGKLLCLLMERGAFYGMGLVPQTVNWADRDKVKECLEPLGDNDFIRQQMHQFAEENPEKVILWKPK